MLWILQLELGSAKYIESSKDYNNIQSESFSERVFSVLYSSQHVLTKR